MRAYNLSKLIKTAKREEGVAIGPILFVIAILGVLAAALAAGGGAFTSSTANDSARLKASALLEIGDNLKLGFDRVLGRDVGFDSIVIHANNTSTTSDLFSPIGGGINPPSITMAENTTTASWRYISANIKGLGTGVTKSKLAAIKIAANVCGEINNKIRGSSTISKFDAGDWFNSDSIPDENTLTNWPDAIKGSGVGCIENNNTADDSGGYWFYQVLGVR